MRFVLFRLRYTRSSTGRNRKIIDKLRERTPELKPEWIQPCHAIEEPEIGVLVYLPERSSGILSHLRKLLSDYRAPLEEIPLLGRPESHGGGSSPVDRDASRLLESGKSFSHIGLLDDARLQLAGAIEANPGCTEAYHYLVAVLRQVDKLAEAERLVMSGLVYNERSSAYQFLVASILEERGKVEAAMFHLKKAIELDPGAGMLFCKLGGMLHRMGQTGAARLAYEEALSKEPELGEAAGGVGALLMEEGRFAEAADWLTRGLAGQGPAEIRLKLGWCYLHQGQEELAEIEFLTVSNGEDADYHLPARFSLGRLYLRQEQYGLAQEILSEVCELHPQLAEAHRLLAEACACLEQHQEALEHWKKAAELAPELVSASRPQMALCLSRLGLQDEAEDAILDALQESGPCPNLLEILATIHMARENWGVAAEILADAHSLDPESAMIAFQQGWVSENLGEHERAVDYYRRALRLDPDLAEAYTGLGWIYYERGQLDISLVLFEKALEATPDNTELLDSAGWVHLLQRDYTRALEMFERALDAEPESDFFRSHRGAALYQMNRLDEARQDLQKVLSGEPEPMVEAFCRYLMGLLLYAEGRTELADAEIAASRRSAVLPPEFVALTSGRLSADKKGKIWRKLRRGKKGEAPSQGNLSIVAGD